jgi:WhiB family transcriptional regulator, redox-sensing transcriptional regulator
LWRARSVRISTDWMVEGRCRAVPTGTMFPHDSTGVSIARKVCAPCPCREQCLEYALANRIGHGIWGGRSERERNQLLRTRRAVGAISAVSRAADGGADLDEIDMIEEADLTAGGQTVCSGNSQDRSTVSSAMSS